MFPSDDDEYQRQIEMASQRWIQGRDLNLHISPRNTMGTPLKPPSILGSLSRRLTMTGNNALRIQGDISTGDLGDQSSVDTSEDPTSSMSGPDDTVLTDNNDTVEDQDKAAATTANIGTQRKLEVFTAVQADGLVPPSKTTTDTTAQEQDQRKPPPRDSTPQVKDDDPLRPPPWSKSTAYPSGHAECQLFLLGVMERTLPVYASKKVTLLRKSVAYVWEKIMKIDQWQHLEAYGKLTPMEYEKLDAVMRSLSSLDYNLRKSYMSDEGIDPFGPDLICEVWTAALIVWLPYRVGVAYRVTKEVNDPFDRTLTHYDGAEDSELKQRFVKMMRGVLEDPSLIKKAIDLMKPVRRIAGYGDGTILTIPRDEKRFLSYLSLREKFKMAITRPLMNARDQYKPISKKMNLKDPPKYDNQGQSRPPPSTHSVGSGNNQEQPPSQDASEDVHPENTQNPEVRKDTPENIPKYGKDERFPVDLKYYCMPDVPVEHRPPPFGESHTTGRWIWTGGKGPQPKWRQYARVLKWQELPSNIRNAVAKYPDHWKGIPVEGDKHNFQFSEDGTSYKILGDPIPPIPDPIPRAPPHAKPRASADDLPNSSPTPGGHPPTPWSKTKSRNPLQYEPVPSNHAGYNQHGHPFHSNMSGIPHQQEHHGDHHQDGSKYSSSSNSQHKPGHNRSGSTTRRSYQPYLSEEDDTPSPSMSREPRWDNTKPLPDQSKSIYDTDPSSYNPNPEKRNSWSQNSHNQPHVDKRGHIFHDDNTNVPDWAQPRNHNPFSQGSPPNWGPPQKEDRAHRQPDYGGGGGFPPDPMGPSGTPSPSGSFPSDEPGQPGHPGPPGPPGPPEPTGPPYDEDPYQGIPYYREDKASRPLLKADIKAYPVLKDTIDFDQWYKDCYATAKAQGTDDIWDMTVIAPDATYKTRLEFYHRQTYTYAVLRRAVRPPELREHVEANSFTCDAMKTIWAITNHMRHSTSAVITLREMMIKITSDRLDLRKWNKPVYEYIISFVELMNRYNKTQGTADLQINWRQKKTYLQNAVSQVRPLQAVIDRETDRMVLGGEPFGFPEYLSALKNVATRMDEGRDKRSRREINVLMEADPEHEQEYEGPDTSRLVEFAINELKRQGRPADYSSKMNRDTWNSLSSESQKTWDTLAEEEKSKILSYAKDRSERRDAKANVTETKSKTTVNFHETDEPKEENTTEESQPESQNIQVSNVVTQARSEAHPGDPRRMLGTRESLTSMFHTLSYESSDDSEDEDGDFADYWKSTQDFHQGCR